MALGLDTSREVIKFIWESNLNTSDSCDDNEFGHISLLGLGLSERFIYRTVCSEWYDKIKVFLKLHI